MKMNRDLAIKYPDMESAMLKMDHSEHYPTVRFEGKESLDLPPEGTMTVEFKRVREENSVDEEGNKRYNCTLELTSLVSVEGGKEAPTRKYNDASEALDKLMKAAQKEDGDSEEEEY